MVMGWWIKSNFAKAPLVCAMYGSVMIWPWIVASCFSVFARRAMWFVG